MVMPEQKPGKSKQDYQTPKEFMQAVCARFGCPQIDLAASAENRQAPKWIDEARNSLSIDWISEFNDSLCWLNPPFSDIEPWVTKCEAFGQVVQRGRILFLTPASVGSNWYAEHVHRKACVLALSPRLTFVDQPTPYPKDLILSVFGQGLNGFDTWRWK